MSEPAIEISDEKLGRAQRAAVLAPAGALLVIGAAGSGRSTVLAHRAAQRLASGVVPERILLLGLTERWADSTRLRLQRLAGATGGRVAVATFHSFATRLLRDHAAEAGLDPFFETVPAADRLAMLVERFDELPLRRHQIRGNPAAALAGVVGRIDRLKADGVSAAALESRAAERERAAADDAERDAARRDRELAELYGRHDEMLRAEGNLDPGDVVLEATRLLEGHADVRAALAERCVHVAIDELEDVAPAHWMLLSAWIEPGADIAAALDDDQAILRGDGAHGSAAEFESRFGAATTVTLERSVRCGPDTMDAAHAVVSRIERRLDKPLAGAAKGERTRVRFWRCGNARAQAQAVSRELEALIGAGARPDSACVVVPSLERDGNLVAAALEDRSVPTRITGAASFFARSEVRDLIAWLRLLANPGDSAAVVRALTRPPVELRAIDLARCTTIARRRKLDMVSALKAALESPQLPPEGRDRIHVFLRLHRAAVGAFEERRPEIFVPRLIERIGLRRQQLFSAHPDTVARLANVSRLARIATAWARRRPSGTTREFAGYIASLAENAGAAGDGEGPSRAAWEDAPGAGPPAVLVTDLAGAKALEADHVYVVGLDEDAAGEGELLRRRIYVAMTRARREVVLARSETRHGGVPVGPAPAYADARAVLDAEEEIQEEELFGPLEGLHSTFRMMRDEVLDTVWRVGGDLGELRLDTYMDVNRAIARYLELLKVAALVQRPTGQGLAEGLESINELLRQVTSAEQRNLLETSALDRHMLGEESDERRRRSLASSRGEPSLEAFIPRRGDGLALSAGDIDLYRTCPLKYKFARVFAIPQEPTINQRFGILIHQVLERFHAEQIESSGEEATEEGLRRLLALLDAGWRRAGLGAGDDELQFRDRAVAALARYWERHRSESAEPIWLERGFAFTIGPHHLRGRVDRVDRLSEGGYELIDYKTGSPKGVADLARDVQLSLYQVAARQAWDIEPTKRSYYYVLDDEKVPVTESGDEGWIESTVLDVGEGILDQDFEPRPSHSVCSWCDYRTICPAAEL